MKSYLMTFVLLLTAMWCSAQYSGQVNKKLDMMEKSIALTPAERDAVGPLWTDYFAGAADPAGKKAAFDNLTRRVGDVIGAQRWQTYLAYEKKQAGGGVSPVIARRIDAINDAIPLSAQQRRQIAEIMVQYDDDSGELRANNATEEQIKARWGKYVEEMSAILGGRDQFQKATQAIKNAAK